MSAPMTNNATKANAERLKAEGNALHLKQKYKAAYEKYSQAIKADPENPMLWSNRAATCLAMKRYMDGAGDAEQATKLDSSYSKAWSRLGSARYQLKAWTQSIEAWNSALECLPTNRELTDEEKGLRVQFEAGLKRAQDALQSSQKIKANPRTLDDLPWKKAFALKEELVEREQPSSGFVIMDASENWDRGVRILQEQERRIIDGKICIVGKTGALEALSNAILCDPRIFHQPIHDFFDRYQRQITIETTRFNAWQSEGPKVIQEQALKRLEEVGWEDVKPALAVTIRTWILRGFFQLKLEKVLGDWLEMAVEMIEWGRSVWKDVPKEQKGVIFDDTFLLGLRRLFLIGLLRSLGFIRRGDIVPDKTLQKIQKVANTMLAELDESKPSTYVFSSDGNVDFGFWAGFWAYPRGEALAALAWCELRIAHRKKLSVEKRLEHYAEAADLYREAAKCFPKDDETNLTYRTAALESFWYSKAPLSVTLPYAQEIPLLVPGVQRIWGASPVFMQMLDGVEEAEEFVQKAQQALRKGTLTLGSVVYPECVGEAFSD